MRPGSSAEKLSTEQQLYALAVRALTRRAHSIHEMRRYLERRAEGPAQVSAVIARLRTQDYLNDARYAIDYARHQAQARRQGRFRITGELRARGVADDHIDAALKSVFAETDETALVRARLKRHLAQLRGTLNERKARSLYRSLLRAGFSSDVIYGELRKTARVDLPDSPGPEGE
ncbi:MAG TPA: regulatory protein RecX [Candidatus Acidoferrales bacterium]|nr:regulatory protein RecX [Candidatus Acidoferrales bacterium]